MTTGQAAFTGYPPTALVENREQRKYRQLWENPAYRNHAPGELVATEFIQQARPKPGNTVIDFGAGTGRGALTIAAMSGAHVTMLDFVANSLDHDVRNACTTQELMNFVQHDLTDPMPVTGDIGFCTDVMEHIPTDDVDTVLANILASVDRCFFQISLVPDSFGETIGETLHLTVKPFEWWYQKLRDLGAFIIWGDHRGSNGLFYVTKQLVDVREFYGNGVINIEQARILDNVRKNCAKGYTQAMPHSRTNQEAMLLCGGPSLNDFTDDIIAKRAAGMPLICTNGTYEWALSKGLKPSVMIVVDGRDFNARFVNEVVPTCRYLFASQCSPELFAKVPADQIVMWHSVLADEGFTDALDEIYGPSGWCPVPGGSTVTLRALCLLRMLGWWRFHVYGFDSCLRDDAHHAYQQDENGAEDIIDVTVGDRVFQCHPWMAGQAQEFQDIVKRFDDEIALAVYGDGLIAHIINEAAAAADGE